MENFRVAVLGAGKSGTTALFYTVHGSLEKHLQRPVPWLFEPRTVRELDRFSHANGVIKAMLPRFDLLASHPLAERLTHRVLIFRDPRDNIVSFILWRFATRLHSAPEDARARALRMFARKQSAPDSVSLLELIHCCDALTGGGFHPLGVQNNAFMAANFLSQPHAKDWFAIRYEDFVEQRLTALSQYFAIPLDTAAAERRIDSAKAQKNIMDAGVQSKLVSKLKRTASYGDWVNWFTPEDYEGFIAKNAERMAMLGYDAAPYTGPKHIKPEHCLGYAKRLNPGMFIDESGEAAA